MSRQSHTADYVAEGGALHSARRAIANCYSVLA
jgi:hypothetical protein